MRLWEEERGEEGWVTRLVQLRGSWDGSLKPRYCNTFFSKRFHPSLGLSQGMVGGLEKGEGVTTSHLLDDGGNVVKGSR